MPMKSRHPGFLDVELRHLPDLQAFHSLLLFQTNPINPDRVIRPAFQELRERVSACGLNPDSLLHVGVPDVVDGDLISYDCCIECPLPEAGELRILPGGRYVVLTVEKKPARIRPAIRTLRGDYLPDHGLIPDEERPVYEIYFKDTLEYCVPVR
jgi:DNA gyrase inhibitor GyrI